MTKKILIIFGAGASYDYSNYARPSVLTDQLIGPSFINKLEISNIIKNYEEVAGIFSEITTQILNKKDTFESALQKIKDNFGEKAHRKAQFVSLEFFLKDTFDYISNQSNLINNYQALVTKIKDYNDGKAFVITFNYDSLFEKSITDQKYEDINHYLSNNIQIIKPHGSHDWAYISNRDNLEYEFMGCKDDYDYYKHYPNFLIQLRQQNTSPYHIDQIKNKAGLAKFPAIAVPLTDKEEFVCPPIHTQQIKVMLSNAEKILIIGWKAGDKILVELMKHNIAKQIPVTIVTESKKSSEEVMDNLKHIDKLTFNLVNEGFSGFIANGEVDKFFK